MTMMPMYKRCSICGRMYSWNPDVGRMFCPYCMRKGRKKTIEKLIEIMRKKR